MEGLTMDYEQFVSLKTAKKLREVGFDWRCGGYITNPSEENYITTATIRFNWNEDQSDGLECYSRPTQAMAMRWLRDIKGLIINIVYGVDDDLESGYCVYVIELDNISSSGIPFSYQVFPSTESHFYKSYEDAAEDGIQSALTMINFKKDN